MRLRRLNPRRRISSLIWDWNNDRDILNHHCFDWFYGRTVLREMDEKIYSLGGGPLRCGPDPVVSVDNGGKLFERINANEPAGFDKCYRRNKSRISTSLSEFLPTPRQPPGQGAFRSAGRVSFVTFLCPSKKSKDDRWLPVISAEVKSSIRAFP